MIPFQSIPGQSRLFLDFLHDFGKVSDFYRGYYKKDSDVQRRLKELEAFPHRRELVQVLQGQHPDASSATKTSIERIGQPHTVAVVTGQQMGFFSGPLFTLYKAIGIIKYCEQLKKSHPDHDFVPVFWLELEDHDFEEIRSINLIDVNNTLKTVSYLGDGNDAKDPIYKLLITSDLDRLLKELQEILYTTDFSKEWQSLLRDTYSSGSSLAEAFKKFLMGCLGKYGLLTLDPSDINLKKLARPVFEKELTEAANTLEALRTQTDLIKKAGYDAQVEPDSTNLFMLDTVEPRHPLNRTGSRKFKLRADEMGPYVKELRTLLASDPQRFIPNVVLRPIVQDTLLPTLAYMAGPSEIAYFAQFRKVYEILGIQEPLIVPRPFVTILEKKIGKVLDKFGLSAADIVTRGPEVLSELAARESGEPAPAMVGRIKEQISALMTGLQEPLGAVDPGLKGASKTALDKVEQALQVLQSKAADGEKRAHELKYNQVAKALTHLRPGGHLQERTLNVLYYMNKYGLQFVDRLYAQIQPLAEGHQVIEVD